MAGDSLLSITLSRSDGEFRADLQAPSGNNSVADLHVHGLSPHAVEAIQICLTELQARAADGDEIALRFT